MHYNCVLANLKNFSSGELKREAGWIKHWAKMTLHTIQSSCKSNVIQRTIITLAEISDFVVGAGHWGIVSIDTGESFVDITCYYFPWTVMWEPFICHAFHLCDISLLTEVFQFLWCHFLIISSSDFRFVPIEVRWPIASRTSCQNWVTKNVCFGCDHGCLLCGWQGN